MREHEAPEGIPAVIGPAGRGLFVALVTVLVATVVATILLFTGIDWARYLHSVGLSIAFAGITLGSIYAGTRAGAHGWLVGLLTGGGFAVLAYLLCLLVGVKEMSHALAVLRILAACVTGALGGILGVNFVVHGAR